nr:unnamed protein product [Callosobruchus chinensis]
MTSEVCDAIYKALGDHITALLAKNIRFHKAIRLANPVPKLHSPKNFFEVLYIPEYETDVLIVLQRHQPLTKLLVILALIAQGLCLKIEAVSENVDIEDEGIKYKVYMNENNHDWDSKPTPLFKITDYTTSEVPVPEFGPSKFKFKVDADIVYALQSFDYETQESVYYLTIQDTQQAAIVNVVFYIKNIDDENPTLSYPQCDFDEHTLYDISTSTCKSTVTDPDGWLAQMTFKIIPTAKNEDKIFSMAFKDPPPTDNQHAADVYMILSEKLDYKTSNFYSFNIKAQYNRSKLENALRDIQNGTESYRTAEKKYGIPKSTLEFKLKHPGHKETLGPSPVLTLEEEALLVSWIRDNASKGCPRKANDLKNSVQRFLFANPRPNQFKDNRPGEGWVNGFLKRHPEISKRTSEGVTSASACVSEQDIRNWFTNIREYIKQKGLQEVLEDPSRIFNSDESGFQICPSTGKVFAMKGSKNVYSVERSSAKENITVLFTFSADGTICVPMVVYPNQRFPEKIAKNINPKWGVGRSDNGWMTSETFYQYIANIFHPHLKENGVKLPVILFLDGHKSHLNYQLSLLCNELQIEIISLYPNATRTLQPCDVSIFRPMKEAWRQSVREWEEQHPGEVVNKAVFARILEKAVDVSTKTETVINGFKVCGLYPFDPNAIDYTKCLGKDQVQHLDTVEEQQNHSEMDYETFLAIVGPEKIKSFQNFRERVTESHISDENLSLLFNIWTAKSPSAPARKDKRNIERFPFAITSENYQEMFRKKQQLKEEQEKQKENRKKRILEKENEKKRKNKSPKCFICLEVIKSYELECDECKRYYHRKCVPLNHAQHIPSDDDLYICHTCYKLSDSDEDDSSDVDEKEIDELYEQYKEAQKFTTLFNDGAHHPTKPEDVRASITVNDLRDSCPVWTKYFTVNQIDELTNQTFKFEARDGDTGIINGKLLYSKVSEQNENANYITIDKDSGELNVKPIDRDTDDLSVYKFQIKAYMDEPGDWSTPLEVALYINDLDNNPPVIVTKDKTNFKFKENFDGSFDHPILIADKDTGENAQFSVALEQIPNTKIDYTQAFIVTPNAGYKSTTSFDIAVRNKTYLDFENPDWRIIKFNLLAKGTLDKEKQDRLEITVELEDVNDEPPKFDKAEYKESIKETAKKGEVIIKVMATDKDQEDKEKGLIHTILGSQMIQDSLSIDKKSGVVTVKIDNAFDYDKVNPVIFQVKAEDNAIPPHTATVPVTITLLDVNNKKPIINTGDPIQVEENQIIGTKLSCVISATDPDTTANLIATIDWTKSYAMKNSIRLTDPKMKNAIEFLDIQFSPIENTRGINIDLVVNSKNEDETSPDFETFDSLYLNIVVEDTATDSEFKQTQSTTNALIMISIIDVNDNAPYFPEASASKPENRTVTENSEVGTSLGYSIQAIDVDLNDTITYACSPENEEYDWLEVDPKTGAFSVKSDEIDADKPLYYFIYTCTANDSVNHQSEPLKVPFYIIDTNDNAPTFKLDEEIHIDEESDKNKEVKAINPEDKDRDEKCKKQFNVEDKTNIIRVMNGGKNIDRDTMEDPTFACEVICEDCRDCPSERKSHSQKFKIILDDINDNTPVIDMPDGPMVAYENVKKNEAVHEIIAQDIDEGDNAAIVFSIKLVIDKDRNDCTKLFKIEPDDSYQNNTRKKANLIAAEDLRMHFETYTVSIHLCDKGKPPLCGTYDKTLEVNKYNFIAPKFVFPEKDKQAFILLSVQEPRRPLVIYKSKEHLQDFSVTDNIKSDVCVRWDTVISLKQINPEGSSFFMLDKKDICTFQLQVKDNFDPDVNIHYELQLTATINKNSKPLPGEGSYTSNRNILINFFSNTQEPTFAECETREFKVEFCEEDDTQNYKLQCQAKYQIDDQDLEIYYFLVSDNETIHSIFKVDSSTGTVSLQKKLDFETQEKFEFQVVASNDSNPTSTNQMSYVKITVNVLDINDHAPEFDHKQFFGALMNGYLKTFTIVELTATDMDKIDEGKLTYSIYGDINRKGEGIQDINDPFQIDEVSGKIFLNFNVEATMSGYFSFNVMVKDIPDGRGNGPFNSTAPVTVFILTTDNTVKFRFENTNIDKDKDSSGKELNVTFASLYFINSTDEMQIYSLKAKPVQVVDADYILSQVRNVETYLRLSRDLRAQANLTLLSFPTSDTTQDDSDLLRAWLIGVSVALGALCVLLLIVFVIKTRRLSNKIKKLTSKQFGSQESGLNNLGLAAPNTNRNAVEGSNPVFRDDDNFGKDNIMDFANTEFDRASCFWYVT